jgi:RNA polymerase sigma-70 factor (ECF subfamily)
MSDDAIIARIQRGDDSPLMTLYRAYRNDFIYWAVRHFSCDEEVAKDVFQMAITIFYENVVSGKLTRLSSSVKTYLFAIGKNKLHENQVARERDLRIQRHEQDRIKENFRLEPMDGDAHTQKEDMYRLLETALNQLGEPCRTVLDLYYYREMSIEQIAQKMDYKSNDSAKTQKYKCLTRLKKLFQSSPLPASPKGEGKKINTSDDL